MTTTSEINPASLKSGFALAIDKVNHWGKDFYLMLPNLVVGAVMFVFFCLLAWGVHHAVSSYFMRNKRQDLGRLLSDFFSWVVVFFGLLVCITIIIPSLQPVDLLSSLGFGSLAVGIAFKDILQNWFSGLLILLRLPFRRGDQIVVGDMEGTVQAIEPRATVLRTYDGRDIIIPNNTIYTSTLMINTSQPRRRYELDFTVGYAYDIREITRIIQHALAPLDEILDEPAPQVLCWELGSTSLGVKVRWWIHSEQAQAVISRARAIQAIKEAFDANDIDPTDPQLIFYQRQQAGNKPTSSAQSGAQTKKDYGPPPEVVLSSSDPELDQPKRDDKSETMLPEA